MAEAGASSPGTFSQHLAHTCCHELSIYLCISSNDNRPGFKVMPRARRVGASQHLVGAPGAWVNRRSGRQHKMSAPNGQRSDLWLKRRCPQARRSSQATVGQVMSPESPPRGTGQSMARTSRPTVLQARPLPQTALHCPRSAARPNPHSHPSCPAACARTDRICTRSRAPARAQRTYTCLGAHRVRNTPRALTEARAGCVQRPSAAPPAG